MDDLEQAAVALLIALVCFYILTVYLFSVIKKITLAESRDIVNAEIYDFFCRPSMRFRLNQQDIAEMLDVIVKFSEISRENTRWKVVYQSKIPYCNFEIFDVDLPQHFPVIRAGLERVFERIFAYNGVNGITFVTYERTLTKDVYHIVVYWAATPKAKKALQQKVQNISGYNRREELAKTAPFIDKELEREMNEENINE